MSQFRFSLIIPVFQTIDVERTRWRGGFATWAAIL